MRRSIPPAAYEISVKLDISAILDYLVPGPKLQNNSEPKAGPNARPKAPNERKTPITAPCSKSLSLLRQD